DKEDASVKEFRKTREQIEDLLIEAAKTGNVVPRNVEQQARASATAGEAASLLAPYLAKKEDKLLSVSEAKALGVPFGTTEGQAKAMGITPKGATLADLTPAQQNAAFKLSDDFEQASKDFFKARDAYNRVLSSAQDPSAAGDLALIFNYMKVLDPGSVVREGEFATAANTGSIPETIWARYNKVITGERLSPNIRDDFVDRSNKLFQGALKQQKEVSNTFSKRAEAFNIPANFVVREIESVAALPPKSPKTDVEAQKTLENIVAGKPITSTIPPSTLWPDAWNRVTSFFGY
ncbi:MAG: hypothetical protein AAB685_00990, partial [Patescibacteria group bacterium]